MVVVLLWESGDYSAKARMWIEKLESSVKQDQVLLYGQCQELLKIATEDNSDELMGIGYYYLAMHYMEKSEADQVMYCLMEGIKYFPKAGMNEYMARAYNVMGAVVESQDNYILSLEYYYTSLSYCETYKMTYVMGMVESNMANILHNMGEHGKAIELTKKAVRHYEEAEETPHTKWNLALCYVILGHCYLSLRQYREAETEVWKLDLLLAGAGGSRIPHLAIDAYRAEVAYYNGDGAAALRYIDQVMDAVKEGVSVIEFADSLGRVAELMINMGKYKLLLEMREYIESNVGSLENLSQKAKWYLNCIICYEKLGMQEEYIQYAKSFFALYQTYSDNGSQTALKAIELRNKLDKIKQRQYDMLELNARLRITSRHDAMTGMANRTYLNEYMEQSFEQAKKDRKIFGVELMDIDYFKHYNDSYGHMKGDNCIERVAMVLKGMENDKIFCARYGGDEFMILYFDMTKSEIRTIAMGIKDKIWQMKIPHETSCGSGIVTVSQGIICAVPEENHKAWDFTIKADRLLYQVKNEGRNGILIEEGV